MYSAIYSALIQHWVSGDFGLPAAYENRNYDPVAGQPWAALHNLPSASEQDTISEIGRDLRTGIFQVSLFYPSDSGHGLALSKADEICRHFVAGTSLNYSGQTVRITSVYTSPGRVDDNGWYQISISAAWTATTLR